MNNYGEEWAYWYLRLNGFFPLANFVVHKDKLVTHRADVDLLAIRPPHVYEEIGGQHDDWDPALREALDLSRTLALICEVKTGHIEEEKLFRDEIVDRAVKRLGLVSISEIGRVADALRDSPAVTVESVTFAKVLFSQKEHKHGHYLNFAESHVETFVEARIQRYSPEKYNSRLFFPSHLFQDVVRRVHRERGGNSS